MTYKLPQIYSFACPQAKKEKLTCPQVTKTVVNYMNPNRGWMINKFIDYLPSNVVLQIVNGVIPQQSDMSDIMA